jgi:acyl-CoA synthetase (AMP-forming)/AMP-acid ligase II
MIAKDSFSKDSFKALISFKLRPGVKIIDYGLDQPFVFDADQTNQRITTLRNRLLNLKHVNTIGILSTCNHEFACLWLALCQAGKTGIPINYKQSKEKINFCLQDAEVDIVFYSAGLEHLVPSDKRSYQIQGLEYEDLDSDPVAPPSWNEDAVNSIIYTSGTTGPPKGVVITYGKKLRRDLYWRRLNFGRPGSVSTVHTMPIYHQTGLMNLINNLTLRLQSSVTIILVPKFDSDQIIDIIDAHQVTAMSLVPSTMLMLLNNINIENKDLRSVQHIDLIGSLAPPSLLERIKNTFSKDISINNGYGSTEAGAVFAAHPQYLPTPMNSVGYPLSGLELRIVDNVLQIRSPIMFAKYNKLDHTDHITDDGFYITGDLFRVDQQGFYYYLGRSDDMFKSGGEKIYPREIESVINQYPAVADSVVLGLADEIKGHKPFAVVELRPDCKHTTEEQIQQFVIPRVATYQIPKKICIIDELPRTDLGKIDKPVLQKIMQDWLTLGK